VLRPLPPSSHRYIRRFAFLALLLLVAPSMIQAAPRTVHVFVALADNQNQGIIPVPAALGNGRDPQRNLYWGAAYGLKTFFKASKEWELVSSGRPSRAAILERCIFKNRQQDVLLVADAYEGSQIKSAVSDFLSAAAGRNKEEIPVRANSAEASIAIGGAADLIVYVGHDAFMDFQIPPITGAKGDKPRHTIVLACASKAFFAPYIVGPPVSWLLRLTRSNPLSMVGSPGKMTKQSGSVPRRPTTDTRSVENAPQANSSPPASGKVPPRQSTSPTSGHLDSRLKRNEFPRIRAGR
jgi:hypothetical protein